MKRSIWYRPRRLASSVWLPWAFGLLALSALVVGAVVVGGRVDHGLVVPTAVLDAQQASTDSAAQQVRRGLNAGLQDLTQLGGGLTLAARSAELDQQLKDFLGRYRRYRAVYVLDAGRHVLSHAGGAPHPESVPGKPTQPGMTNAVRIDQTPVVVQYLPLRLHDGRAVVLAAEYDVAYVRNALDTVRPTTVWVVNSQGQVVASNSGFVAFQQLERGDLRQAGALAHDKPGVTTSGSRTAREIVAYAPVHGDGPASALSWGVVTSRSVDTIQLPQTQARNRALLFALLLGGVTLGVFGWMYLLWLRPLRQLVRQAEGIADGDVHDHIEVRRYDEVGGAECTSCTPYSRSPWECCSHSASSNNAGTTRTLRASRYACWSTAFAARARSPG
jgi:hypothetical protein